MRFCYFVIIVFCFLVFNLSNIFVQEAPIEKQSFSEIWAYVMVNEEYTIPSKSPITDLAYFSCRIDSKGSLYNIPPIAKIKNLNCRKHMVVAEVSNSALMHFILSPEYKLRDTLIQDIANASLPFDGIQIDFETILSSDKENYLIFLSLLKEKIGSKMLSVALPARTYFIDDPYNYKKISAIADRIIVMAYDEHWSGSLPGSIASIKWSEQVAKYAFQSIGVEKLIMGLPFYGRAWGDSNPIGAYKYSSVQRILNENSTPTLRDAEGIPYAKYSKTINITVYFEDIQSILIRTNLYQKNNINKIGFWRLGQEDILVWDKLQTK